MISDRGQVFENPPFQECHASTLVEVADNTFLYAWFGGNEEGADNVNIWGRFRYTDKDNEWGPIHLLATGKNGKDQYSTWNPVLFRTNSGLLILDYKVGPNPREWWAERITSSDQGHTWSRPKKLKQSYLGPIRNKGIQLDNGNIIYPSSTESVDDNTWNIHVEISDENGNNWEMIDIDCDTFGVIQPTILQHKNGLQMLCRSKQNKVIETWSYDQGKTWTKLSAINLPNPNSGIDAISIRSDLHLLVYNPLLAGVNWWEGRTVLNVAISKDGKSWSDIVSLENHDTGEYSYPAVILDSNNNIRISYTDDRKNIKFVDMVMHK